MAELMHVMVPKPRNAETLRHQNVRIARWKLEIS